MRDTVQSEEYFRERFNEDLEIDSENRKTSFGCVGSCLESI